MPIPPGRLTDLEADEIALVDKAANKRKFILFKAQEADVKERIQKAIETLKVQDQQTKDRIEKALEPLLDSFSDDHLLQVAKAVAGVNEPKTDPRIEKALSGLVLTDAQRDQVTKTLTPMLGAVSDDAQLATVAKALTGASDAPPVDPKVVDLDARIAKLEKAASQAGEGSEMARETLAIVKSLREERDSLMQGQQSLQKRLDTEVELRRTTEYERRAEEYGALPLGKDEVVKALRAIDAIEDDAVRASLTGTLQKANKTVQQSALLSALGGRGRAAQSVMAEVRQAAETISKEEKVPLAKAMELVMDRDHELAQRYLSEARGESA